MTTIGYSDRINHALAFAAKHHDQEVRKGTRLPYFTAPANAAVILTRYGQDEETVVAAILHEAVDDYLRDGYSEPSIRQRLEDKFGASAVDAALGATRRRLDDDGVELSHEEQKIDHLQRLASASARSRWVLAAREVHEASTLLADLRRTAFPDSIWLRFAEGREAKLRWYRQISDRLDAVGFDGAIMGELHGVADALAAYAEQRGALR
ncbi:MAG: HD domain-containing protein [Gemmatirosa sp.]|nr:HD domain-containing protein [Gemmatirosa sp.]